MKVTILATWPCGVCVTHSVMVTEEDKMPRKVYVFTDSEGRPVKVVPASLYRPLTPEDEAEIIEATPDIDLY